MSTSLLPTAEDVETDIDNTDTILIVDDDTAVRSSMTEFFRLSGLRCFMASSAEDALDILKTQPIHLVITDILMPGMDGLELTDLIRKYFDADVIVMTGYSGNYSYELAIGKGASDFVTKPIRFPELLLRVDRVFRERRIRRERDRIMARLERMAITDELTGLYNSRHFYAQIRLETERSNRYHHPLSLLMMDIDFFKDYNDQWGHLEGDRALAQIGQLIRNNLRTMDSAYRYGGEEFTAILPDTRMEEAGIVAERVRLAVEKEKFLTVDNREIHLTVSIGVTRFAFGEAPESLVVRADKAMYMSKKGGRNRISFLDPEPEE